jgi:4-coumarate--CoA ligase
MPEKVYKSPYPTFPLVEKSVVSFLFNDDRFKSAGDEVAFIDAETEKSLTRNDVKRLSFEFAYGARNVLHKLGGPKLKRGSTILIFSPNSIAYPIMLWGGMAAGFKCTLANSGYTPPELAHQWHDSKADALFVHPALIPIVLDMFKLLKINEKQAKKKIIIASFGLSGKLPEGFVTVDQLLGKGALKHEEKFDGRLAHETALICYSSGTTGKPKGVEVRACPPLF